MGDGDSGGLHYDIESIRPEAASWDTLFLGLTQFEPGLKLAREQPVTQQKRPAIKR